MSTSKPIIEFCCTESIARFRLEEPSWETSVRLFSSRSHACHLGFHLAQQLCREDSGTGQAKGSQGQVPRLGCVTIFFQIVLFAIMVDNVVLSGGRMMCFWPISSWSRPPTCLSQTWTYFLWSGGQDQQPSIYTIIFWLQYCGIYTIIFEYNFVALVFGFALHF